MVRFKTSGFFRDEDGAITIDWVMLTAGILALTLAVFTIITKDSVRVKGQYISDKATESAQPRTLNPPNGG